MRDLVLSFLSKRVTITWFTPINSRNFPWAISPPFHLSYLGQLKSTANSRSMCMNLCWPANLFRVLGSGKGMWPKVLNETSCWKLFPLGKRGYLLPLWSYYLGRAGCHIATRWRRICKRCSQRSRGMKHSQEPLNLLESLNPPLLTTSFSWTLSFLGSTNSPFWILYNISFCIKISFIFFTILQCNLDFCYLYPKKSISSDWYHKLLSKP